MSSSYSSPLMSWYSCQWSRYPWSHCHLYIDLTPLVTCLMNTLDYRNSKRTHPNLELILSAHHPVIDSGDRSLCLVWSLVRGSSVKSLLCRIQSHILKFYICRITLRDVSINLGLEVWHDPQRSRFYWWKQDIRRYFRMMLRMLGRKGFVGSWWTMHCPLSTYVCSL